MQRRKRPISAKLIKSTIGWRKLAAHFFLNSTIVQVATVCSFALFVFYTHFVLNGYRLPNRLSEQIAWHEQQSQKLQHEAFRETCGAPSATYYFNPNEPLDVVRVREARIEFLESRSAWHSRIAKELKCGKRVLPSYQRIPQAKKPLECELRDAVEQVLVWQRLVEIEAVIPKYEANAQKLANMKQIEKSLQSRLERIRGQLHEHHVDRESDLEGILKDIWTQPEVVTVDELRLVQANIFSEFRNCPLDSRKAVLLNSVLYCSVPDTKIPSLSELGLLVFMASTVKFLIDQISLIDLTYLGYRRGISAMKFSLSMPIRRLKKLFITSG